MDDPDRSAEIEGLAVQGNRGPGNPSFKQNRQPVQRRQCQLRQLQQERHGHFGVPRAGLACVNRQLVFKTQTSGSIQMSRKVFVPDNDQFARWLNIFTNIGGSWFAPLAGGARGNPAAGGSCAHQAVRSSRGNPAARAAGGTPAIHGHAAARGRQLGQRGSPAGVVEIGEQFLQRLCAASGASLSPRPPVNGPGAPCRPVLRATVVR
jgi:hypothetical protein